MQQNSIRDIQQFSNKIGKIVTNGDVIFLYGEIGTGKTTFARFLINGLEITHGLKESNVLSPTFNIVYDYEIKDMKIMHYDLYRLKDYNDIIELGMFEDHSQYLTLIEWPELIKESPKSRIEIYFKYSNNLNDRTINVKGFGKFNGFTIEKN